jgi:UDP-glucose 4-epimerase
MENTFLVTGGCGFIGSHLIEELLKNKKNQVVVLDNLITGRLTNININNKNLRFYNCDISKNTKNFVRFFKNIHTVFHLAALADIVPSINDPLLYYRTNVTGTINVLNACKINNVKKIVYAASASCYGVPKKFPTLETSKISLNYPYALTKKIGEDLLLHWAKVYKLNCTSLRLFNVYGPRSRTSGAYGAVFGVFLAQKISNKPLTIVGNGNQTRDFIYVKDVACAFIAGSKFKKSGEIFNIGSGKQTTVNFIANAISKNHTYIPKRPAEPDRSQANITKATKLLKWKPIVNIKEGIEILLKNIDYWRKAPVWNPESIKKATKIWFKYLK